MSLLEYNEIKERKYIIYENEPYEVLTSHVFRKQQRKPVNATKLKNLITGSVKEISFHVSEKVEEAEIDTRDAKYLYNNRGEYWFSDPTNPSDRFAIKDELIGPRGKFLKPNTVIGILSFRERHVGFKLPVKVELKVTEAVDAVKGNTVQGGTKTVTLETGATVNVPMFINQGEIIRINTETGEYVERVN
ncbi:MAG: elongation factor P [Candidatus Taylorbacteria bacterium]|nr:elongation factor P [Candidatus Taylorbacteria bacterium]